MNLTHVRVDRASTMASQALMKGANHHGALIVRWWLMQSGLAYKLVISLVMLDYVIHIHDHCHDFYESKFTFKIYCKVVWIIHELGKGDNVCAKHWAFHSSSSLYSTFAAKHHGKFPFKSESYCFSNFKLLFYALFLL